MCIRDRCVCVCACVCPHSCCMQCMHWIWKICAFKERARLKACANLGALSIHYYYYQTKINICWCWRRPITQMCASTHIQTTHMYKVSKLSSNPPAGRLSLSQEKSPFPKSWCPSLDHTFGMVCGQKRRKQWQKYFKTPNLHESVPQLTNTRPTLKLLPRLTKTGQR